MTEKSKTNTFVEMVVRFPPSWVKTLDLIAAQTLNSRAQVIRDAVFDYLCRNTDNQDSIATVATQK